MLGAASFGLAVAATPASAQHIDQIVAFGDSYADDGNLFDLIGIPYPSIYSTPAKLNGRSRRPSRNVHSPRAISKLIRTFATL